jgi:hypothetical protein
MVDQSRVEKLSPRLESQGRRHDSARSPVHRRLSLIACAVARSLGIQVKVVYQELDIGEDDVRVNSATVTIDLPEPQILSASLDEEKTRVYDRDFSPLNVRPDDDLVEEARLQAVEKIRDAARENEILVTAEHNAEDSVRAFVTTLGFEQVRFR